MADYAGVEAKHLAEILLGLDASVEAHGEVVARAVAHLMHADGLGQRELAPVLHAADHALAPQNQLARCQHDLAHLGELGRSDLEGEREGGLKSVGLFLLVASCLSLPLTLSVKGRGSREGRAREAHYSN